MVSVGPAAKVDSVDLQKVVNAAPAFARPLAANSPSSEADQRPDISVAGRLKSTTAATLDAASRLTKPQTWNASKATSSDESVVQAASNQAKPGTYKVEVDSVAMAQATASATFSSISTVVGIGTLKIELGSWNGSQTTFATNPNWPKASVTFGPKDTSLQRIRDKINAAGIGVIASVVSDATGSRLVLRSTATGSSNGFRVEAEAGEGMDKDSANALSAMGFDPSQVRGAGSQLTQPSKDAQVSIDGRKLQSEQNLIEDESSGLSLRVKGTSSSPVTVRVEPDADAIRHDIQAFAATYNELSRQLAEANPEQDERATQAARDIQSRVQKSLVNENKEPDAQASDRFGSIGIRMSREGLLEVDPAKLADALNKQPAMVERLFAQADEDEDKQGLARRLADIRLPEPEQAAIPVGDSAADEPARTAAGAIFRQKLLEQYAAAENMDSPEADSPDAELLIQANEA